MPLPTLTNLADAGRLGVLCHRRLVAASSDGIAPLRLMAGTEKYADGAIRKWHREPVRIRASDVACYMIADAVVSKGGLIWARNHLVTDPAIMPRRIAKQLELESGGSETVLRASELPITSVDGPCLFGICSDTENYAQFLLDLLFRILVARQFLPPTSQRMKILLARQTPAWLTTILISYLKFKEHELVYFHPEEERVHLKSAIISTPVYQDEVFHRVANDMLESLLTQLSLPSLSSTTRKFFIVGPRSNEAAASEGSYADEPHLAAIAREYGFQSVAADGIDWLDQVALFASAEIILGLPSPAMHNALFCLPGTRIATIGPAYLIQSQIGALRRHQLAYLSSEVRKHNSIGSRESEFEAFLESVVC